MLEIVVAVGILALIGYSFTNKAQHAGKGDGKSSGPSSSSSSASSTNSTPKSE